MGIKNGDIEKGNNAFYPNMQEDPQLRWGFIRKVYSIICLQLLITVGVSAAFFFSSTIKHFLINTPYGVLTMVFVMVFTMILMCTIPCWSKSHPWNYIFMFIFTLGMAFMIGCACAFRKGDSVLLAAFLTTLVTVSLTLYTFWAAKRGHDFSFLGPFLLCAVIIFFAFGIIRIILPYSGTLNLVYGCIGALLFSAFIIYDTDNLIKRYDYDEYLIAAATLYLDILNLFSSLLNILE